MGRAAVSHPSTVMGSTRALLGLATLCAVLAVNADSIYDYTVKDIDGNDVNMEKYRGKVVVMMNVASL